MSHIKPFIITLFSVAILFTYQNCAEKIDGETTASLNSILANGDVDAQILKNGPQFFNFKENIPLKINEDLEIKYNPILDNEDKFTFKWEKAVENQALANVISTTLNFSINNGGSALDSSVLGPYKLYIYFQDKVTPIAVKTLEVVETAKSKPQLSYIISNYTFNASNEITVNEGTVLTLNLSRSGYPLPNNITVLPELDQKKYTGFLSALNARLKIKSSTSVPNEVYSIIAKSVHPQESNYKIRVIVKGSTVAGSINDIFRINVIRKRGVLRPLIYSGFTGAHNPYADPPVLGNLYQANFSIITPGFNTYKNATLCDNLLTDGATKQKVSLYDIYDGKACKIGSVGVKCKSVTSTFFISSLYTAYTCK